MKKINILLFLFATLLSCKAQDIEKINSNNKNIIDIGYVMSNLRHNKIMNKSLFKNTFHITIFQYSDPNLGQIAKGTDEVYDSLLFTIAPDGDYYTKSVTYRVKRLINPSVFSIKELSNNRVEIIIKYGMYNDKKEKKLIFNCM